MALGRIKANRQRSNKPAADAAEPDPEFESYLAALDPEDSLESTGTGRRFGNAEVYQLRLPLMANERLKELAAKQGTSPASLARDWIMQHLEIADQQPAATPDLAPAAASQPRPPQAQPHEQLPEWPGEETAQYDLNANPDPFAGAPDPFQPNPETMHPGLQAGPAPSGPAPSATAPAGPAPAGPPPSRPAPQGQIPEDRTEEITVPHGRFN